jgi:hypothetical protein
LGDEVLILCGAVAIPVIAMDIVILKVHRRASTGLDWDKTFAPDFGRVLTKLLGLFSRARALRALLLDDARVQRQRSTTRSGASSGATRSTFAVAAPLYMFIVDGQMRQPRRMPTGSSGAWCSAAGGTPQVRHREPLPDVAREGVLRPHHVRVAEAARTTW